MSGLLEGKVALVTGSARGQGAAIAEAFVREGATAVITDVLDDAGRACADRLGDSARFVHLDVTRESDWDAVADQLLRDFGGVDVLVNNAGVTQGCSIEKMTLDEYLRVVMINQVGCHLGMRAVLTPMRRRGGGSIINTSSVAGMVGVSNRCAYTASKFAVRGMSKVAALEFGPDNIRVNTIYPGAIDTPMNSNDALAGLVKVLPISRMGEVQDVADLVVFLASDRSAYISGADITIDGGMLTGTRLT